MGLINLAFHLLRHLFMKLWSTASLSILSILLAAYAGYLSVENNRLKKLVEENEEQAAAALKEEAAEFSESSTSDGEPVSERPFVADESSPPSVNDEFSREERRDQRREERQGRLNQMLANLQDPEFRMDLIERNMGRIDQRFAAFFKTLDLSSEEIDLLKTLMAEREVTRAEGQMRMIAAEEEDREAIREETRLQRELLVEDIKDLLGEEEASRLVEYTQSLPFRSEVAELAQSLSYTDSPLSEAQSESIVSAYTNISKNFEYTHDLTGRNRFQASEYGQEAVDTYLQEREVFDSMVLEQAARTLNDSQLTSLAEKQISDREREARQLQFSLENPGGGNDGRRGGFGRGGGRGGFGRDGF